MLLASSANVDSLRLLHRSMDETQDDSRENSFNRNSEKDEKIYEGSSLTLNQFRFIFIFFVHKMKLPLNQRDNLVKFVEYFTIYLFIYGKTLFERSK